MQGLPLITGATGFAGGHLLERLTASGGGVHAFARAGGQPPAPRPGVRWTSVDLLGGLGPTAFALATRVDALGTAGTINASTNPVDWSKLKGVPPGFADGVDDVGNFTASNPIAIVGTDIRLSAAACVAGEVWKWTGTLWDCVPDANSGGTVTSVTAGAGLLGGVITGFGNVALDEDA